MPPTAAAARAMLFNAFFELYHNETSSSYQNVITMYYSKKDQPSSSSLGTDIRGCHSSLFVYWACLVTNIVEMFGRIIDI